MRDVVATVETESHQRYQWIVTLRAEAEEAKKREQEQQRKYDGLARLKSDEVRDMIKHVTLLDDPNESH